MPLMAETAAIVPQLMRLVKEKRWWTVGSQPAVDGIRSEDQTYGFGPKGGYIYQKAFVEFWATEEDVRRVAAKAEQRHKQAGLREVTWYAAGRDKAQFKTNMEKGDANAVTWGVFAGKEIVTTTLIEEVSFRTWKVGDMHLPEQETDESQEEAFSIWTEWEHLFPADSPSRKLLKDLTDQLWLVSVVHHDFKRPDALWDFLLD
jgi:methylenetetrahydrofolate reductase (NADPH)